MKKKENPGIIIGGVAFVIGVALVTCLSSKAVIDKVNSDADKSYMDTLQTIRLAQEAEQQRQNPHITPAPEGDPSEQQGPVEDDDAIYVDHNASKYYIVIINGESYISSDFIDGNSVTADDENVDKLVLDESNTIVVDGVTYIHIDSEKSDVSEAFTNTNGYIGFNYVDIDADGNVVYHISAGDTLSKISDQVGYSVDALAEYNGIKNPNLIYANSSIRIPVNDVIREAIERQQAAQN